MTTVIPFRPRVDTDAVASTLLVVLGQSRGVDAYEVANSFLHAHPAASRYYRRLLVGRGGSCVLPESAPQASS
jgi:hypothetical protein